MLSERFSLFRETGLMACLLKNEPASHRARRRLTDGSQGAGARASLKRAPPKRASRVVDPKPGELSMARVKRG